MKKIIFLLLLLIAIGGFIWIAWEIFVLKVKAFVAGGIIGMLVLLIAGVWLVAKLKSRD